MKSETFKLFNNFIDNNYGNSDNKITKLFKNIHCPLPITYKNNKKHYRYIKNVHITLRSCSLYCCAGCSYFAPDIFCISFEKKRIIKINILLYINLIKVLNPCFEILNINYPNIHMFIDFKNQCLIINHRLKIYLSILNIDTPCIIIKYDYGVDSIKIDTDAGEDRQVIMIHNLFDFSLKNQKIDMSDKLYNYELNHMTAFDINLF